MIAAGRLWKVFPRFNWFSLNVVVILIVLSLGPWPQSALASESTDVLNNPFQPKWCTYLAYDYAPLIIQQLLWWTLGKDFPNHPAHPRPLPSISWDADQWPQNVRTWGSQFDPSLNWNEVVAHNGPYKGALVVWLPGSTTTWVDENGIKQSWTFDKKGVGHIAYVADWISVNNTITVWETGWAIGGNGNPNVNVRKGVAVTGDMIFIHAPQQISPPPTSETQRQEVLSFQSIVPIRNIKIQSASRFELSIDGKFVFGKDRPASWTTFSLNYVWVGLAHQHTVQITWWQVDSDPTPQFSQTWWPNTEVSAAEPDPSSGQALAIAYTYIIRPSPGIVGQPVYITADASSSLGFPISSIDVTVNGNSIGTITGSSGALTWDTSNLVAGNYTITFTANADGWNGKIASTSTPFLLQGANFVPQPGSSQPPAGCQAPPIEDLSFSPASPVTLGTTVNGHAKATWNPCFRAMRLKIDGGVVYESGSPEFTFSWDTNRYSAGDHTIQLEVAAQGDDNWSNPSTRTTTYTLQAGSTIQGSSCQAPPIEDLSFNPSSPAAVGTTVNVHAKAAWNTCFRSMRLKIDGNVVYELGSPEFTFSWDTASYGTGSHTVRLEVAAQGDNSWSNPSAQEVGFSLQASGVPTSSSCQAPPIEDLSFNPASPTVIGDTVSIHAKAVWNSCFRSMRLKIDGAIVYELGSPEFTYSWNTNGYGSGNHTIRLEVAAQGDNSWSNPAVQKATYSLQSGTPPTTPPCQAPPIEDLSFNPGSPSTVGATVNIHAKATWNSCFRSMRLKIDGGIVYELGSPEFTFSWNTSGYSAGNHNIRLEVAAQGDNSWSNPSVHSATYNLQSNVQPTSPPASLGKPNLISPANGALLAPGTDITLEWNPVSGASQYLVEIWGGQYGGTHTTPCGWQNGTSCHIGTMSSGNVLWRVQARDGSGNLSPWSDEWNFTPQ